jgi:MFS family permease
MIGTSMGNATIYWLTIHVANGKAVILSVLVAAQFLPILIFSRKAGHLMTRHAAARVLVVTQAAQALGALGFGIPLLFGWIAVWYLWLVSFMIGCAVAVDVTARQMFMLDLVGPAELRKGSSLYSTFTGLAKIIGPALAGILIATIGESAAFLANAASFLPVIAVLITIGGKLNQSTPSAPSPAVARRRLTWIFALPNQILVAVASAFLIGGFGYQFEVTNPLMATGVFHLNSTGFGLLGTCMACGGIAGSYLSSRRPDPGNQEFVVWAGVFGGVEIIAAFASVAWFYDVTMALIGAATALFGSSAMVFVQQATPEGERAYAVSAYNTAYMGFVPVGAFVIAGLSALAGSRLSLAVPGFLILIFVILILGGETFRQRKRMSPQAEV